AYTLATFGGHLLQNLKASEYICRPTERGRNVERNSYFAIGLQAQVWVQCLEIWSDLVSRLLALKPHKRLHFHKGMKAISLIQSSV
ncbi:MAG: IS4 family transposase, partial [Cyanobacteriota bacterium]